MPADPRLLRLRIQRLMQHGSSKSVEIADLVEQADELARSLPPEKTCKDNTWTTLRSSGLLEELAVMVITLPRVIPRPAVSERKTIANERNFTHRRRCNRPLKFGGFLRVLARYIIPSKSWI